MLKAELSTRNLDLLIFIRDLDGLETETVKIKQRNNWFKKLSNYTKAKCLFLLNIYALEALIIADITTFNSLYGSASNFKGNPMKVKKPKEELISMTRKLPKKYTVSQNPEIFDALRISVLQNNCRYFNDFLTKMDAHRKM
ncbi:MAG: DUF4276 family protein [Bacteroidales bacterium]|nr:DUF4276 family protein [Bacteroidales bacterium]